MKIFNLIIEDREWGEVDVYSFSTYEAAIERMRAEIGNAFINLINTLQEIGGIKNIDTVPTQLNEVGLIDGRGQDIELLEDYTYDVFCEAYKTIIFYNGDNFTITLKESELN